MTPAVMADKVTRWMLGLPPLDGQHNSKLNVIDGTAGLGGHTLSFAASPRVSHVKAYEIDKGRFQVFLYGIDIKAETNIISGPRTQPTSLWSGPQGYS